MDEKCDTNTQILLDQPKKCKDGYQVNEVHGFCEDVDECASSHTCQTDQICVNRIGSFQCLNSNDTVTCEPGLILNGQKCEDKDECSIDAKCDKDKQCINLLGSYQCIDKSKNETLTDNSSLQSRDALKPLQPVLTNQTVHAVECESGEERNQEGQCVEIDFCGKSPEICGPNAKCYNALGKHRCECNDGYAMNQTTNRCEDKDECETNENSCLKTTSTCKNLVGSYKCECKPGFRASENDKNCINIDECNEKVNICHHNCLDKPGSYECTCYEDYVLQSDNRTCVEQDLCRRDQFCDGVCEKKNDEYICKKCATGFSWDPAKGKCISENECKQDICPNETCIHLRNGSSACVNLKCPFDYDENSDEKVCYKKDTVKDARPLAISKRVLILPLNHLKENKTRTIYRFKQPEQLDGVEFGIELSTLNSGKFSVDETYFRLLNQQLSHNLLVVRPIEKVQDFIIEMNVSYKKKKLHTSTLYVFVV